MGQALPALGVLAAEPLYLLWDTAVVGRLGALPLAGLAVGALILATVSTQLTFLSYGTTARSARRFGAGDPHGAVTEGVAATWIALGVGAVLSAAVQVLAGPVTRAVSGGDDIASAAESWVRVASWGIPLILVTMAGNGWLRGVQRPRAPLVFVAVGLGLSAVVCPMLTHGLLGAPRIGLVGSAWANLLGQSVSGLAFLAALVRSRPEGESLGAFLRPRPALMAAQLRLGRDLIVRSLSFQICFVSAGAVAARVGAQAVGAHQIAMQLWNFISLLLDSLAIAAQTLVGAALGAADRLGARRIAARVTVWSAGAALLVSLALAVTSPFAPHAFTSAADVIAALVVPWWLLVGMVPVAGVVFALDGVLLGAADAAYLRTTTLASALVGFLPMIWLSYWFGWGLAGIWSGLAAFMVLRCAAVVWRVRGSAWTR
ncbi:MATE family efflux transporter [Tsukamurella sp. 8F]|uniref:MATE family efflux transporter n=1 Tax=unclassified Tsukamurella TaxID=2633480 RepID=UPI0023B889D9|nr:MULTISPECIES: MATE family efflux transporter [unclassified Tsukamurella]MDF0532036.1 MATE family efflux transporter [Tsukamurella sp. 8J]MDF0587533.1 MATE family efflux transporter [Tsukamurella sp. 8F]